MARRARAPAASWFRPTCTVLRRANSWRKWPKRSTCRCWPGAGTDKPLEIVRGAIREAKLSACDVILVDTAGRLHIDDDADGRAEHAEEGTAAQRKSCSWPTP